MTHVYFSGHSRDGSEGVASAAGCSSFVVCGARALEIGFITPFSSFFTGVAGGAAVLAAFPKSNAVPGVFGVLFADPNEANAPEPNPKAVDAPEVGEDMFVVVNGDIALNGFARPWEGVSPPNRLVVNERTLCSGLLSF